LEERVAELEAEIRGYHTLLMKDDSDEKDEKGTFYAGLIIKARKTLNLLLQEQLFELRQLRRGNHISL
jgi:hypothetical protein